jgi:hypothetical protein
MEIYNKESIVIGLNKTTNDFIECIKTYNSHSFEATPDGKWSAGQNLEHLYRAIKPVAMAFGLPVFIPRLLFGKANRPSKTFNGLLEKYNGKLATGGRAGARFVPPPVAFVQKEKLATKFEKQKDKLIKKVNRFSEIELDKYILPHPLLGKLTFREMLFFTIFHNEHHLHTLQQRNL